MIRLWIYSGGRLQKRLAKVRKALDAVDWCDSASIRAAIPIMRERDVLVKLYNKSKNEQLQGVIHD